MDSVVGMGFHSLFSQTYPKISQRENTPHAQDFGLEPRAYLETFQTHAVVEKLGVR